MKTLSMLIGNMGGARQLAEMIRRMGRGNDTVLAHITPEEAEMLRKRGGSGSVNPETGLPEFQPMADNNFREQVLRSEYEMQDRGAPEYYGRPASFEYPAESTQYYDASADRSFLPQDATLDMEQADLERSLQYLPPAATGSVPQRVVGGAEEGFLGRSERAARGITEGLERFGTQYPTLARFGGAAISSLPALLQARSAMRDRERMANELRSRAAPYRQLEQQALQRVQGEGLSAQEARELERTQAAARQGLTSRQMGTGSAAAGILAGQRARAQSTAREQSFAEAARLAGIVDELELRAMQQELAANREISTLLADIIGREVQASQRTQVPAPRGRA